MLMETNALVYLCQLMNYLSVENVSISFGERTLFENLTFGLIKGQKVALLARNGTGKSTLLKILKGEMTPNTGRVVFNKDIRVGFLQQNMGLDDKKSILENVFSAENKMTEAIRFYEKCLEENSDPETLQKACEMMDQYEAWDFEAKAKQILDKLELKDLSQDISNLSGGQKRRISLAKVLIDEPDLLLLDEPTNHLDLEMVEWLEEYLVKTNMTLLMITHDRYFLEVICNEILELDDQTLYRYKGNYSYFLEKREERKELEQTTKSKAQSLMKRELVWMRSTPKARTGKSKYREGQFSDLKKRAKKDLSDDQMKLEINIERLGGKIIELHRIRKSFGDVKILNGFDYVFKRGEKIGISGKNGSGKSTFLNLVTGQMEPDGGKVVIGDTVVFGYYNQSGMNFRDEQRVIDVVKDIAEVIPLTRGKNISAAQMLERFLFPRSMHYNLIEKLSGGEKKRLHLLTVLMKNPNFLILDEPTNDLDVFALNVLEDYLLQYTGVLIVVSHDRYFVDKLVDHILVFKGDGEVKDIIGNYSDWRLQQSKVKTPKAEKSTSDRKEKLKAEKVKTKLSFNEKFEFDNLEKDIPKLEAKKEELEQQMNSGTISDHEELTKLAEELGQIIADLDAKTDRWIELSEFV